MITFNQLLFGYAVGIIVTSLIGIFAFYSVRRERRQWQVSE